MFFMKFDINVRLKILQQADLCEVKPGHVLFKQGDYGDKMYIILRGSVNVIINYTDQITGQPMKKVVAWMRDGASFGEYSMLGSKSRTTKDSVFTTMQKVQTESYNRLVHLKRAIIYQQSIDLKENNPVEKWKRQREKEREAKFTLQMKAEPPVYQERTKRAADIIAVEDLMVLELSREFFREIILGTIKDEYERKMRLLSEIALFKEHELLALMPIANFFRRVDYKLGEPVQLQGESLGCFSIIYQGRCKVVNICSHKRVREVSNHVKGLKSRLKNLFFGDAGTRDSAVLEKPAELEDIGFVKMRKQREKLLAGKRLTRMFSFTDNEELNKRDDGHLHYQGHVFVAYLERGSIFGFRSAKAFTMQVKDNMTAEQLTVEPAKLSVLCETSRAVLYHFDMKNFKYLPEEVKVRSSDQKTIISASVNIKDYDMEDVEAIKKRGEDWDEFKKAIYQQTILDQYHKRRIDDYKCY